MANIGDPPMAHYHPWPNEQGGNWLCNAAADCDLLATYQWPCDVTEDNVAGLRALLNQPGMPVINPGDTVAVYACDTHKPQA